MHLGGAPAGPAGIGKTETIKDFGKSLAIMVFVLNSSDSMTSLDFAKYLKGVCQAGIWACFDDFNRINLSVLSVIAVQMKSVITAKRLDLKKFMFPNEENPIALNKTCSVFITMNPGYAGRA